MIERQNLSRKINLNNLTYYFKSNSISSINFISFKGPFRFYKNKLEGNKTIEDTEK